MSIEFTYRWNHTYKEYLAQQYLKENIDCVISKNLREAVGSIDDIFDANTTRVTAHILEMQHKFEMGANRVNENVENVLHEIEESNDNLEIISADIRRVEQSLDVINSNLVNGFQALFVGIDELGSELAHISRGIGELVDIARTPVQTWALNQYEIARDAVRRKLFPEALDALELAIHGNEHHTGYKTDFKFYHLRGVLLLGIPGEPESSHVVDLAEAENEFLLASRYARHDNATEAAQALVGAGKAAYANKNLAKATRHITEALKIDPRCGEANYQMARLCVHCDASDSIRYYLENAFDIHWSFAIRAGVDLQFSRHFKLVEECVRSVTQTIADRLRPKVAALEQCLRYLISNGDEAYNIWLVSGFESVCWEIGDASDSIVSGLLKNTFETRAKLPRIQAHLKKLCNDYCALLISHKKEIFVRGTDSRVDRSIAALESRRQEGGGLFLKIGAWVGGGVALIGAAQHLGPGGRGSVLPSLLFGLLIFLGFPIARGLYDFATKQELEGRKLQNERIAEENQTRLDVMIRKLQESLAPIAD